MKGLQTLIVDKETVLAAVQEYMDKSITPNVVVKSVAPYAPSTNTSQYGGMNVPDKFEIKVEQKVDTANA
jgi:hypothetical protein